MAVKYIYVGPNAADFTTWDLILNTMLSLMGWFPGVVHALWLFMRHKGYTLQLKRWAERLWRQGWAPVGAAAAQGRRRARPAAEEVGRLEAAAAAAAAGAHGGDGGEQLVDG